MKEKEYTSFKIMFREIQDYLLENEGVVVALSPIQFGFNKFSVCHQQTGQLFSIKSKYLEDESLSDLFFSKNGVDEFVKFINDIESLKKADAIGNVKC